MKFKLIEPPRIFDVGKETTIQMKDCAHIELEPDEQITLKTEAGAEYDIARKSWGFYATPSLNGRLEKFGLKAALIKSPTQKFYVFMVEKNKKAEFHDYLKSENQTLVCWLDNEVLLSLEEKLKG